MVLEIVMTSILEVNKKKVVKSRRSKMRRQKIWNSLKWSDKSFSCQLNNFTKKLWNSFCWKIRENTTVFVYLTVDNFDLTRKNSKITKITLLEKIVKIRKNVAEFGKFRQFWRRRRQYRFKFWRSRRIANRNSSQKWICRIGGNGKSSNHGSSNLFWTRNRDCQKRRKTKFLLWFMLCRTE